MRDSQNRRETGARKHPASSGPDPSDQLSQDAAGNEKPHVEPGLSPKQDEVEDKTHQSEGRNPRRQPTPSPSTEKSRALARQSRSTARTPRRPRAVVSPAPM